MIKQKKKRYNEITIHYSNMDTLKCSNLKYNCNINLNYMHVIVNKLRVVNYITKNFKNNISQLKVLSFSTCMDAQKSLNISKFYSSTNSTNTH